LLEAALDQTIEPYSSPGRTTAAHSYRAQSGEGPQPFEMDDLAAMSVFFVFFIFAVM
jgi:hypothetical protein